MLWRPIKRVQDEQDGVVLIEALLVIPILTILTFGILEFGNMMWQRQQLQVGVRDAARYWSRCRDTINSEVTACNETVARNIAFYGNPDGTGNLRVPGWGPAIAGSSLSLDPAKGAFEGTPGPEDIVRVVGAFNYIGSPVYNTILEGVITVSWETEMRHIGW
ncbi:MAG: pilus assembly protein [Roseovarius sp.]|nr:pilus assembly protein [Roseovarius sp.]